MYGYMCRFPSTIMDPTTEAPAPKALAFLLWRRPKAASILVDGKAAHVAVQPTPTPIEGISLNIVPKRPAYWGGGGFPIAHIQYLKGRYLRSGRRVPPASVRVPPASGGSKGRSARWVPPASVRVPPVSGVQFPQPQIANPRSQAKGPKLKFPSSIFAR